MILPAEDGQIQGILLISKICGLIRLTVTCFLIATETAMICISCDWTVEWIDEERDG
jgi:hypothetical protein